MLGTLDSRVVRLGCLHQEASNRFVLLLYDSIRALGRFLALKTLGIYLSGASLFRALTPCPRHCLAIVLYGLLFGMIIVGFRDDLDGIIPWKFHFGRCHLDHFSLSEGRTKACVLLLLMGLLLIVIFHSLRRFLLFEPRDGIAHLFGGVPNGAHIRVAIVLRTDSLGLVWDRDSNHFDMWAL